MPRFLDFLNCEVRKEIPKALKHQTDILIVPNGGYLFGRKATFEIGRTAQFISALVVPETESEKVSCLVLVMNFATVELCDAQINPTLSGYTFFSDRRIEKESRSPILDSDCKSMLNLFE